MCLIALALDQHPQFPLVIAANRDEFLQRPAAALDWWQASPMATPILAGRDLRAGGTWMGLNTSGRVAMLTNVRDLSRQRSIAPSRGAIVSRWLETESDASAFWHQTASHSHNPFNLVAGDMKAGQWWWADDRAMAPQALVPGLYGLSNAALDTPWPKVRRLKAALAETLNAAGSVLELETLLFDALADRTTAPDGALPDTGVGLERERVLAPAFIRTQDNHYGTRCSTLLIVERGTTGARARIVERQFDAAGAAVTQRGVSLLGWPVQDGTMPVVRNESLNPG
jgi:uncharacterized protein with NRDE domain